MTEDGVLEGFYCGVDWEGIQRQRIERIEGLGEVEKVEKGLEKVEKSDFERGEKGLGMGDCETVGSLRKTQYTVSVGGYFQPGEGEKE